MLAGYEPILLCNDEGTGMASAKKNVLAGTPRQGDTFHALSHRLGLFVERFEKAAYKAIGKEYDCMALAERSKTFPTYEKRYEAYHNACRLTKQKTALCDSFTFLYHCLLEQLQVFDNQGVLKDYDRVLLDFDTALGLLLTLNNSDINAQHIETSKGELFHFRTVAKTIVEQLTQQIPQDTLHTLCLAWQTQKKEINAKQTKRKNALKRKKEAYHNHRRFRAGKRKGKTPFELLTNQVQEKDWMQIILEKAA